MSTSKITRVLSALALLAVFAISPAQAQRYCYPYADGAPGGYNKLTHSCNPLLLHLLPGKFQARALSIGNVGNKGFPWQPAKLQTR